MDRITLEPELLKEMEHAMINIRWNLKVVEERQNNYADIKRTHKYFKMRDHVSLRVKPRIISLRMGTCAKLVARYCGPFEVLERVGLVAYRLALPPIVRDHNVFHVFLLNKYVHTTNNVIDWIVIQVEMKREFHPKPQCILDRRETMLQNRAIMQVKVQWQHFGEDEATWELEDAMRMAYPFLFPI
jgi:hypothetical protein